MNLSNCKASQDPDIPLKINNNSLDIFKKILTQELNRSIEESRFPNLPKAAKLSQYWKKLIRRIKHIIEQLVFSILPNLSKLYKTNYILPLIKYFLLYSALHISKRFYWPTLYYQTNRKMKAMFRRRFSILCFANWSFESFWLSFIQVIRYKVKCIWIVNLSRELNLWQSNQQKSLN